ncbi:hypothetical protein GCM10022236_20030 [Microlunatus ginsengisoli]|uniref:VWFA domain-containing protein n=1 Tax=Microlunatus ginsengisoli TaxID=363863 RepID=A0ABP6ZV66_9ACTN
MVPPATGNNAVITVKVGGNRTSQTAVGNLAGVQLGFYAAQTGGTALFICTSDSDGDCSITVPNTQSGGANRDARYWVRQISTASGYYTNPNLGTGTTVASDAYTFQTGNQLRNGTTYSSTVDFMISTGSTNNEASGGIWQNSLVNPTFPAKCGINVGVLVDLSNSVSSDLPNLKTAAKTFVSALGGTPSQVGLFTFATSAPAAGSANATLPLTPVSTTAGVNTVNARIDGLALPGGNDGGTNWDTGIYQVAQSASAFDVLVIITDGNPTFYGSPAQGPGNRTRFREVENGIFSANAVKAEGTKVIAFGVGSGIENAGSGLNLRSISGTTAGTDYYQTADYTAAGNQLKALALGNCLGSVTVVKQVVPSTTATGSTAGAQPQGGWTFTGSATNSISVGNSPGTTATVTGAVNFPLTFPGGTSSGTATFTETLQSGYSLHQGVAGQNAVCTRTDTGATIVPGNATNGFTVAVNSAYPVSCIVYNKAPVPLASVVVNKQWRINGTDYPDGSQPTNFVAGATIAGTAQGWGVERTGFRQGDTPAINESISNIPIQCTLTSNQVVLANGATVTQNLPYTPTLIAGQNTYTIRNVVTCQTKLTLTKTVQGGTEPLASWTLDAVAPSGALAGPNGTSGSAGATGAAVTPGVTYPLAEIGNGGSTLNYVQFVNPNATLIDGSTGSWTCQEVGTDGTTVIPGFADGLNGGVTVPLGKWVRCNAINQTATAILRKVVQNTHGGTAVPANWTLTATPTGTFPAGLPSHTVTGSTAGSSFNVRPGTTYTISESTGPSGYTLDSVTCDVLPGQTRATQIGLNPLDTATCTFTNVDQPATLTLQKTVTNDNGGTATAGQWTLSASGPTPISGATGTTPVTNAAVSAGTYALSETGPSGYTAGAWSCTGGTVTGSSVAVTNGANVTCTINNNDQQPRLTLRKTVTNDNGGTASPLAWTLAAAGPTPIMGVDGVTSLVNSGTYTLSESGGPTGYTAGNWSCTAGTLTGASLVLTPGVTAVCTINNNDNPATLTLRKTVTNDNGGTAVPTAWTLAAAGPTPISGGSGTTPVTNATVNAGSYTLSESGGPPGYAAGSWSCTGGSVTGSNVTVTIGANVVCTINNDDQAAHLTLVKTVTNNSGGTAVITDWTLTASGPTSISGVTGAGSVTNAPVSAGTYTLSESGPPGYAAGTWSCSAGTLTNNSLVLPLNTSATCTINNDDQPSTLTLRKTVTNDSGGTAIPTAWTLTATGPTTISGATGSGTVTNATVDAGTYTLSESGGPTGYTAGAWSCDAGTLTGATLVLPLNTSAICTIDNDDQPGTLTLVKNVNNGTSGATAAPADWTLTADGPVTVTGPGNSGAVTGQTVPAGSFQLSESGGPAGYTAGTWSCTGGALTGTSVAVPNGGTVRCEITNTAVAPTLTLVKTVDPAGSGSTDPATAWTLSAIGAASISGPTGSDTVTGATVPVGQYDLGESGPAGYTASDWVCIGGAATTATTVTLTAGSNATCTIINTAIRPTLTLRKVVDNGDTGATTPATAWTLIAVNGGSTILGATGSDAATGAPATVGTYHLSESTIPGYDASAWVCTGGTATTATSVTLALNQNATCTITNTARQPTLTLVKQVVNDNGGTRVPTDWTLTADGPTSGISGPTGDPAVTGVPVQVGSYVLDENALLTGYTASAWSCDAGDLAESTVTIGLGENVTCTIVNNDQPAHLTLRKTVTNGTTGGEAEPTDWVLTAAGPATTISGATGDATVTRATVPAGDYTLSESGPDGYTAGAWSCGNGAQVNGDVVTVPNGGDVTCTIHNTAEQAHLTLVKNVRNLSGGTAVATDWTLSATGPTLGVLGRSGDDEVTNVPVQTGTYELAESGGPAGYTASGWFCDAGTQSGSSVTLDLGEDVTCTITNTDSPAEWTLAKTSDPASGSTVEPGDLITYTVTATRTGGINQTNIVIEDDLSDVLSNATVVGDPDPSTGTASITGTTMTWSIPLLSSTATVTYQVRVNAGAFGVTLANAVTSEQSVQCPPQSPGPECRTTHVTPHFTLSKTSDPATGATVQPGDTISYTLTATNDSDGVLTGATVADDLSGVLANAALGTVGSGGTVSGTTLTWDVPSLQPGDEATLTYTVTVNADAFGVALANVATPGEGGDCVPPGCATTHPTPHYTLTKSSDPSTGSTVLPGDTITYTLTVSNDSDGVVTGAQVSDDLSDVLDNAAIGTIGTGGSLTGTTLTWTVPTVRPGDSATLSYTVTVNAGAYNERLANVATPGPGGECEAAADCTTTHPTPHYTLAKSSDPATGSTVLPGDTITYTLSVTNDSDGIVSGAIVTDDLSDVLDNATVGTIGTGAAVVGDTLTWQVPDVRPGDTATLTYTITVNAGAYDQALGNVATPGPGGECETAADCTTTHPTPHYTLTKSSNPASGSTVLPGDTITYTLTVSNDSAGIVTGAQVTDDLSDVLANATLGTVGSGGSVTGTTLTWTVPTLQPGNTATLSYTVTVNPDTYNETLANVATPGPGGTCDEPVECTTTHPTPHYTLTKNSDPGSGATVNPGDVIDYTLLVSNDSDGVVSGAIVTDDLSDVLAHATLNSVGEGGSVTGSTLTWTVPDVQPGEIATLDYSVIVNDDAFDQTLTNVATPGPGGECIQPQDCTTSNPTPHYTLTKTSHPASGSTVLPGDTVSYTLTMTNDSAGVVSDAVVTDDLSGVLDNATLQQPLPAGATLNGTTLTWTVNQLDPGLTATVTYVVTVDPGAYDRTLANVATPGPGGECETACATTHPTPHYTLTKSSDPATGSTVLPGDTITYTLTVMNDSAGVVSGAVVTDDLSDVLDNATLGTVGSGGSVSGTTLSWAVPTIQPDDTATLTYTVTVNAGAYDQTLGNVATPGPGGECETAADCTTTHPTPHYTLTKSSNPASGSTVLPGDTITYTLTVSNDSAGIVTGAQVTDDLSDVLANATLGTVGSGGSVTGTTLTWTVPTLQPGNTATLSYTVTVNAGAYGQMLANVAAPGPGGECTEPDDCTTTHPTPHYVLEKSSDPPTGSDVQPGDTITYTLRMTNDSAGVVSDAVVTDDLSGVLDDATLEQPLPAGVTLDGTTLTWTVNRLDPGLVSTVSYTVTVKEDAHGVVLRNVATPGPGGECSGACSTTHATPHYTLAKSSQPADGADVQPGSTITYTLTVANDSQATVTGATVTDDLSDVLDDAIVSSVGGGAAISGTSLTWAVPDVAPGASARLEYSVIVKSDAWNATLRNVATPDSTGGCVGSCSTTHHTSHFTLTKSSDPASGATVEPGDTVTYTLTVHNDSQATVTGAVVSDDLTDVLDNAALTGVPDGAAVSGTTLTWPVPDLAPGDDVSLSYAVTVNPDQWGVTIRNLATPGPGGDCPASCSTDAFTPRWLLAKSSDPASASTVEPGSKVTYTLTARNVSAVIISNAVATDDLSDVLDNATLDAVPDGATLSGTMLTWNVPTMAPDAIETLAYTVTVNDDALGQTLRNLAAPNPSGECVPAGDLRNLRAAVVGDVRAAADPEVCSTSHYTPEWTLAKTSDPASGSTVNPGSTVAYTLTATNTSDAVVRGATATDDLSAVLNHATLEQQLPGGATLSGTTLTWAIPDLAAGESTTLTYRITLAEDAYDTTIENVVTPGRNGHCAESCSTEHDTPPTPVPPTPTPTPPPHQTDLPNTGGPELATVGVGLALLVAGGTLLLWNRRRRRTH